MSHLSNTIGTLSYKFIALTTLYIIKKNTSVKTETWSHLQTIMSKILTVPMNIFTSLNVLSNSGSWEILWTIQYVLYSWPTHILHYNYICLWNTKHFCTYIEMVCLVVFLQLVYIIMYIYKEPIIQTASDNQMASPFTHLQNRNAHCKEDILPCCH